MIFFLQEILFIMTAFSPTPIYLLMNSVIGCAVINLHQFNLGDFPL